MNLKKLYHVQNLEKTLVLFFMASQQLILKEKVVEGEIKN